MPFKCMNNETLTQGSVADVIAFLRRRRSRMLPQDCDLSTGEEKLLIPLAYSPAGESGGKMFSLCVIC